MEFFRIRRDIPFMRHALVLNVVSFITFALAVFFLASRGLHLSIEFTGGTLMEVEYAQSADVNRTRESVEKLNLIEGQPIGVFYGAFFALDGNGNWVKNTSGFPQGERGIQSGPLTYSVTRDANGLPITTNPLIRKVIGDPNPDYTASLTNEFTYKKISFRFQLDAVQGVDVFNADWRTRQGVGNGKEAEKEQTGQYPRGYINSFYGSVEQWRIDDGSFVKLREISLSYSFGKIKMFKDITVSVTGRNLKSWDNYKGYDPEVNATGQSTVIRAIDFGSVPIPKTFSIGISAKL